MILLEVDPLAWQASQRFGFSWTPAGIASVATQPDMWLATGYDLPAITDASAATATNFALYGLVGIRFRVARAYGEIFIKGFWNET